MPRRPSACAACGGVTSILLDPHGDDAILFACFTLLRHRPHVVCVLRSQLQEDRRTGIGYQERELETAAAFGILGIGAWEQWRHLDSRPSWEAVRDEMRTLEQTWQPEQVFAPAFEAGGHDDHNAIAKVAADVFGPDRIVAYLTYRRGSARSDWGAEVEPEPDWIALKHRALACFVSQIREPTTRPWFMEGLREWVA